MPSAFNLPSFNLDGFKDTITNWREVVDVVAAARPEGGATVQQVILDRRLDSAFILQLFTEGLIGFENAIAVLKHHFRGCSADTEQANILSHLVELIILQLKRAPLRGVPESLAGRPWFGMPSCDYDHLSSILKDKEERAEEVVVAFFQHPDPEIRTMAPLYLRPFLMFVFSSYKNPGVLRSIWRYLNHFPETATRNLIRDVLLLATDKPLQGDLLAICFEYINVDQQPSEARDSLLLLVLRMQNEERTPSLRRYLNIVHNTVDKLELNSTQREVILFSLALCLERVPVSLLPPLVALVKEIMSGSRFSSITRNIILDSVIQWFSRPCPFIPPATYKDFDWILKNAQSEPKEGSDPLTVEDLSDWNVLMLHDREVTAAIYQTRLNITLEVDPSALPRLTNNWNRCVAEDFNATEIRLIRAMVLSPLFGQHLTGILSHLKRIMRFTRIHRPMPITPLLFKLVQERDPKCQLLLLKILPEFACNYSNIPIILSTIRKFDKIPGLDLVCLELYYRMSTIEYRAAARVIEHLDYLQGKRNKSFEMCLALITIVRRICEQKRGGQNCREMVKFISHIINEDCAHNNDGVVMVVALDAIQILCENQTINVPSTWSAIKENFKDEQRKNVRLKLYSFFGLIPRMVRLETVADEELPDEVMALLWRDLMVETDAELIQAIFNALKEFPYDTMRFIRFPATFREKVKLPKSHLSNVSEEEYTESFPYVPGECWLEMLEKVPRQSLSFISILIAKVVDLELQSLRGLSNELPEGRQEPQSIIGVQPRSIVKALLNYLVAETRNDFEETEHVRATIVQCLAVGFSRPLPHFDWSFLEVVHARTLEVRDDVWRLVCRQVENSLSARTFFDKYLLNVDVKSCALQQVLILLRNFHYIAKHLKINDAEILLRNCLESRASAGEGFESMLRLLNVEELSADLRRIVEEVVVQRYAQLSEEARESDLWTALIAKLGSGFVEELTQPPTEELRVKKQVEALLKNPQEETSAEKIILMQLVASKLKLSKDVDELEFYGSLLKGLVVRLSKLSAIDFVEGEEGRSVHWERYLQELDGQSSVREGIHQVFTCLMTRTRVASDDSAVAYQLKLGLTAVADSHCHREKL